MLVPKEDSHPITGKDIVNVVTQSQMCQFLKDHLDQVEILANARLELLPNVGTRSDVVSVTKDQTMWDAFQAMRKEVMPSLPHCIFLLITAG